MSEKVQVAAKKPEVKRDNLASKPRNADQSQSMNSPADQVLYLQRTIGNQAVQRLIKSGALQAKLKIGQPGDIYEQEADRIADAVMRMPEPQAASGDVTHIQRAFPTCEGEELRRQPIEEEEELQRQPIEEKEEELQAKANSGHISNFNPDLESQIQSLKGGGQPLSENYRRFFEPRFGRDFSQVRIHTDMKAAESAQAVNARAYTVGLDVMFGAGQFAPGTTGKRLLAHELTHVVQQQGMPGGRLLQRDGDRFDETVLQEYLDGLTATGDIENNLNSDNKARAVVDAWRLGGSQYVLDAERKTLLIRQMQRRVTGNKDEQAILEILERSYNPELSIIFRSISADDLKSDFQGTERERLQNFYARRFEGGMHAVLSGTIAPRGYPVPLGLNIEEAAGEVIQRYEISNCEQNREELLERAHIRAIEMVNYSRIFSGNYRAPEVRRWARTCFGIAGPQPGIPYGRPSNWDQLLHTYDRMTQAYDRAVYVCHGSEERRCEEVGAAFHRGIIHLCPNWFRHDVNMRAAILIHEWTHGYGGARIRGGNREIYCREREHAKLWRDADSSIRIRMPDAYACYAYGRFMESEARAAGEEDVGNAVEFCLEFPF